MNLSQPTSEIYVPNAAAIDTALARTTQMGIAAFVQERIARIGRSR